MRRDYRRTNIFGYQVVMDLGRGVEMSKDHPRAAPFDFKAIDTQNLLTLSDWPS